MSVLADWMQHDVCTSNTDHLLYVCKHGSQDKALGSKVDHRKKQGFKDQQCGLVSIKQHIAEGVSLVWNEKCKRTLHACIHKQTSCSGKWVITIVKDTFVGGFEELHSYDPLKHQLVLHYIIHFRVGLRGAKQQARMDKTFQIMCLGMSEERDTNFNQSACVCLCWRDQWLIPGSGSWCGRLLCSAQTG